MGWGAAASAIGGTIIDKMWSAYADKKAASRANSYGLYAMHNAHQIEVEDLKRAGLNPALSVLGNGGGASYSMGPSVRGSVDSGATNTALALARNELSLGRAEARKAHAEADIAQSNAEVQDKMNEQTLKKLNLDNNAKFFDKDIKLFEKVLKEREVELKNWENNFFQDHPYLYNFRLMGGSAQQLGNLNDWVDNIIDGLNLLGKFRGAFRYIPKKR